MLWNRDVSFVGEVRLALKQASATLVADANTAEASIASPLCLRCENGNVRTSGAFTACMAPDDLLAANEVLQALTRSQVLLDPFASQTRNVFIG